MTNMSDLFTLDEFNAMVDAGYVRVQHHPTLPLHIANYAEKAQFENVWNRVTRACRGLIFDDAWTIHARPYAKFFNYGDDANTGVLDLDAPAVVTDKLDGSLGIAYPTPDGPAIATRGSFTSDQAVHATAWLRATHPDWEPVQGMTELFEIVYPANRIVVDYGQRDELIHHGMVEIATGRVFQGDDCQHSQWLGPIVDAFPHATLADALAAQPRTNAEGLVVLLGDSQMVKLKQADYVALHRIITGLNAKTVWEWLGDGKTVGDLCVTVPDEFHGWIEDVAAELTAEADGLLRQARVEHAEIISALPADHSRGDYARIASRSDSRSYLFLLYDGKDRQASELAWRSVKPSGARSMVNHSEAVA